MKKQKTQTNKRLNPLIYKNESNQQEIGTKPRLKQHTESTRTNEANSNTAELTPRLTNSTRTAEDRLDIKLSKKLHKPRILNSA